MNLSAGVAGMSNAFVHDTARRCLLAEVRATYPNHGVIDYQQDGSVASPVALGFEVLGPLRGWEFG